MRDVDVLRRLLLPFWVFKVDRYCFKCLFCGKTFKSRLEAVVHASKHVKEAMEGRFT